MWIGKKINLKTDSYIMCCLKALVCDHRAIKLTELRLLYQSVYSINLLVPPSVTREYNHKVLEFLDCVLLAACTTLTY